MAVAGAIDINATLDGSLGGATLECVDQAEWDSLAARFADHNVRQLWSYGTVLARRQRSADEHVVLRTGARVIGVADVRIKTVPFFGGGIAYVSGGPLSRTGSVQDLHNLRETIRTLVDEYMHRRGLVLRVSLPLGPSQWNDLASELLTDLGGLVQKAVKPYRTLVLDLGPPLERIRADLAQKWRNCLNAAERSGLTIISGTEDAMFVRFQQLSQEFHQRKQFVVDLDAAFYRDVRACASAATPQSALEISLAEIDGRTIAGMLCSTLGDTTVYLLGATIADGLRTKAAYLLQWNAIVRAKSRGIRYYDLGGIDPVANPGVYHFKAGLGADERSGVSVFDFPPTALRGRIVRYAERAYRFARARNKA